MAVIKLYTKKYNALSARRALQMAGVTITKELQQGHYHYYYIPDRYDTSAVYEFAKKYGSLSPDAFVETISLERPVSEPAKAPPAEPTPKGQPATVIDLTTGQEIPQEQPKGQRLPSLATEHKITVQDLATGKTSSVTIQRQMEQRLIDNKIITTTQPSRATMFEGELVDVTGRTGSRRLAALEQQEENIIDDVAATTQVGIATRLSLVDPFGIRTIFRAGEGFVTGKSQKEIAGNIFDLQREFVATRLRNKSSVEAGFTTAAEAGFISSIAFMPPLAGSAGAAGTVGKGAEIIATGVYGLHATRTLGDVSEGRYNTEDILFTIVPPTAVLAGKGISAGLRAITKPVEKGFRFDLMTQRDYGQIFTRGTSLGVTKKGSITGITETVGTLGKESKVIGIGETTGTGRSLPVDVAGVSGRKTPEIRIREFDPSPTITEGNIRSFGSTREPAAFFSESTSGRQTSQSLSIFRKQQAQGITERVGNVNFFKSSDDVISKSGTTIERIETERFFRLPRQSSTRTDFGQTNFKSLEFQNEKIAEMFASGSGSRGSGLAFDLGSFGGSGSPSVFPQQPRGSLFPVMFDSKQKSMTFFDEDLFLGRPTTTQASRQGTLSAGFTFPSSASPVPRLALSQQSGLFNDMLLGQARGSLLDSRTAQTLNLRSLQFSGQLTKTLTLQLRASSTKSLFSERSAFSTSSARGFFDSGFLSFDLPKASFDFGWDLQFKRRDFIETGSRYQPSLLGISSGKTITEAPDIVSGIGIRYPLEKKRKKKRGSFI